MIQLEVWGPYALFTRPEFKVERVSYDVPTPSAARGIVEAIYYHPGIKWHIRRIYVMRPITHDKKPRSDNAEPITFTTIRRNEVKSKILGSAAMRIAHGKEDEPYLVTTKQIVQRASMVLTNVHYVIEAEFEMLPEKAAPGDNPGKFQDIITRRMRKGQCFSTPYFGCREFPAHFKQWEGGPIPTIDETRDLGFMLYDFDYSDPQNITPLYFRAKMEHGVIQVAGCEVFR